MKSCVISTVIAVARGTATNGFKTCSKPMLPGTASKLLPRIPIR